MESKIQIKFFIFSLALVLTFFLSCKKLATFTPPATAGLTASIDTAQWYLLHTGIGTQPGDCIAGSQEPLQTAITTAQTFLATASTTATQARVTEATANLNAAISIFLGSLITPIAQSNLVAYWKFNGNANDTSGNGHNGTLEAGPAGLAAVALGMPNLTMDRFGRSNAAFHFAGGANIDVPYSSSLNPSAITISLWCRQDTAGRTNHPADCYMIALNRWNGWAFQTQPTRPAFKYQMDTSAVGTTYFYQDDSVSMSIGTTVGAGPWNHLVVTYDGVGTESFYLNGVLVKIWTSPSVRGSIIPINPTVDLSIGSDLPNSAYSNTTTSPNYIGTGGYWTGDLDDVMIYNTALTSTQVLQIYTQQVTL